METQSSETRWAVADKLMSAFTGAQEPSAIKEAVCAYVDAMKQRGVTVEHIMIDIKHAASTRRARWCAH